MTFKYTTKKVKDGKINADVLKTMKDGENAKPAGPANESLNECVSITNPDRCELSFKLAECLSKALSPNAPEMKKN